MSFGGIIGLLILGTIQTVIFVGVYNFLEVKSVQDGIKKGCIYGFITWLFISMVFAGLPFMIDIALGVIIYWLIQSLFMSVINGAILGFINK